MKNPLRWVRRWLTCLLCALGLIVLVYVGVSAFPQPMFAHHAVYKNFDVWSDQPIPSQIDRVLDDVTRRLGRSELLEKDSRFTLFFCNAPWRLWLYGQHFSDQVGADADTWLTRNIYLRASDIASNQLIAPGGGALADAAHRPLSYFIAHEATHILESRQFGRLVSVRYPLWLMEGYADYVGKGGDFDFDENHRLFRQDSAQMDFARSGLYRGFHLQVAWLLDQQGATARVLFTHPPSEGALREQLVKRALRGD